VRPLPRPCPARYRQLLDRHGYADARQQTAWRNRSNVDVAASIVGDIRQAALGEALIPAHEPNGVLIRLINKL